MTTQGSDKVCGARLELLRRRRQNDDGRQWSQVDAVFHMRTLTGRSVAPQEWSKWENEVYGPRGANHKAVATTLGVSMESLFAPLTPAEQVELDNLRAEARKATGQQA